MAYIPNAHHFYAQPAISDDMVQAELLKVRDDYGVLLPHDECVRRAKSRALCKAVINQREEREEHDAMLVRTAIHEAAHAVVAILRGHRLKSLALDMDTGVGECYTRGRDSWLGHAIVSAAGPAANAIMDGTDYQLVERTTTPAVMRRVVGYSVPDDVTNIRRHLRRGGKRDDAATMRKVCDKVRALLERADVWRYVVSLADLLLQSHGYIGAKGWRAPKGTLARRIQLARRPKKLTPFERLMKSNEDFWRREGCL